MANNLFLPDEMVIRSQAVITGASKANPCVITAVAHGFVQGDIVYLAGLGGMIEINNRVFTVGTTTTDTFQLSGENSSGHTTYTSGGAAFRRLGSASGYNVGVLEGQLAALSTGGQFDPARLPAVASGRGMQLEDTPRALSTLASVQWTGLPAGIKRMKLVLYGLTQSVAAATNAPQFLVTLGKAAGYLTSGYTSSISLGITDVTRSIGVTNGFALGIGHISFPIINLVGVMHLGMTNTDLWSAQYSYTQRTGHPGSGAGGVNLGGTLDRIKLETLTGVFGAGGYAALYTDQS